MKSDLEKVEETVDEQKSYLTNITKDIVEGVVEGVKEGVAEGLKKGLMDGVKECLATGFADIGEDDITDLLEAIPEDVIKNSISPGYCN